MYLGAKRRYINTLPFLSFPFSVLEQLTRNVSQWCWHVDRWTYYIVQHVAYIVGIQHNQLESCRPYVTQSTPSRPTARSSVSAVANRTRGNGRLGLRNGKKRPPLNLRTWRPSGQNAWNFENEATSKAKLLHFWSSDPDLRFHWGVLSSKCHQDSRPWSGHWGSTPRVFIHVLRNPAKISQMVEMVHLTSY